jgi:small ligand-binding sensory domain FIST
MVASGVTGRCSLPRRGHADGGWDRGGGLSRARPGFVALLVDPLTFPAVSFLTSLNEAHERVPLVGGVAAGGGRPGAQALILDDAVHRKGAIGVVVSGPPVFTVVSQGCRPRWPKRPSCATR